MASLVLRTVKGSPLTNSEVDGNFSNINTEVGVVYNTANTINSNVGVLSNLTTSAKANLVAAINEIASESTSNVTITAGSISNISGSNINITSGTVAGTVITNSTYQGNTIAVAYGGTGNVTFTSGALLKGNGTGAVQNASAADIVGQIGATAVQVASSITVADDTSTNATRYIVFVDATSGTVTENVSSSKLTFNPSTGLLTSTDYNSSSDISLKQDFEPITNSLEIISKLNGFGFTWKDSKEKSYGLSAQEVEQIIPEIVRTRSDGFKGINYMNLTAFLIEAIKDLKQEIQELKKHK
jgi:hypothetical protein